MSVSLITFGIFVRTRREAKSSGLAIGRRDGRLQRGCIRFPHHNLEDVSQELPALSPELIEQADCSQVLPALAKVDEVYQAPVALYYLEDHSYKDIAVVLDVPIGTVKSRIARGIAQLRELFSTDSNSEL